MHDVVIWVDAIHFELRGKQILQRVFSFWCGEWKTLSICLLTKLFTVSEQDKQLCSTRWFGITFVLFCHNKPSRDSLQDKYSGWVSLIWNAWDDKGFRFSDFGSFWFCMLGLSCLSGFRELQEHYIEVGVFFRWTSVKSFWATVPSVTIFLPPFPHHPGNTNRLSLYCLPQAKYGMVMQNANPLQCLVVGPLLPKSSAMQFNSGTAQWYSSSSHFRH